MTTLPRTPRLFVAALLAAAPVAAQHFNPVGAEGDWFTAANWSTTVPTASSDITIANGKTAIIEDTGAVANAFYFTQSGNLTIRDGGTANFGSISTNFHNLDHSVSILIDGAGSKLTTTGADSLGANQGVTVFTVQNGGSYTAGSLRVADNIGSQASFTVTGSESTFTTSGTFSVGYYGHGSFTLSDGATATTAAVALSSGSLNGAGGSGSTVLVTGENTTWTSSGAIALGGYANASLYALGTLTIADGAAVSATSVTVNQGSTLSIGTGGLAGRLTAASVSLNGYSNVTALDRPALAFNHTDDLVFSSSISGSGFITKDGSGTLTLSGANTGAQITTITDGAIRMGHANAVGAPQTTLNLAGGELDLNGFTQQLNVLNVTADSTLRFGGSSILYIYNATLGDAWTGTLTLEDFAIGTNQIYVGSSIGFTATQLSQIRLAGYSAFIKSDGYLAFAPIPEPSAFAALLGLATLSVVVLRRARRA